MGRASTSRRVLALLLVAAIAALGAGCGGDDGGGDSTAETTQPATTTPNPAALPSDEFTPYELAMQRQGNALFRTIRRLSQANVNAPRATIESNLRETSREVRAAAAKLEKLSPPEAIEAEHAALIRAVRRYADDLNVLAGSIKQGRPIGSVLRRLATVQGVKQMGQATTAISRAGYVITIQ